MVSSFGVVRHSSVAPTALIGIIATGALATIPADTADRNFTARFAMRNSSATHRTIVFNRDVAAVKPLEKPGAQIQAISCRAGRCTENEGAKHSNGAERMNVGLGFGSGSRGNV